MQTLTDNPTLRVNVWRPCRWDRDYMDQQGPIDTRVIQECLYAWEPYEDVFGSISSPDRTTQLREALLERFAPLNSPEARDFTHLAAAIELIDQILAGEDESMWADSEARQAVSMNESINLRQHRLLAFRHHLQWIFDTFQHVLGVNLTVR
jgi:hypothetical protein